jgi:hypothetical protein
MAYDIFISYRRKGAGAGVAGELQAKFENRGYKVFLDVDEISSGAFPEQIEHAIESCKDFLLVLAPGTLDRCVDENDWVRREIIKAESMGKNFIGIMLPGFVMPDSELLPKPLQSLPTKQVFMWSHEYRTASFKKIEENLFSAKVKKRRNRTKTLALLPILMALVSMGIILLVKNTTVYPETSVETVNQEILAFDAHVNRANLLSVGLPTSAEFEEGFLSFMNKDKEECFQNLMMAIAEYDTAIMLKKKYPDRIVDSYNVEDEHTILLDLRSAYMHRIVSDIDDLIRDGGEKFAIQDLEIAKILALPNEMCVLDSLDRLISISINKDNQ